MTPLTLLEPDLAFRLASTLAKYGEVVVVAPERDRSGASQNVATLHHVFVSSGCVVSALEIVVSIPSNTDLVLQRCG